MMFVCGGCWFKNDFFLRFVIFLYNDAYNQHDIAVVESAILYLDYLQTMEGLETVFLTKVA